MAVAAPSRRRAVLAAALAVPALAAAPALAGLAGGDSSARAADPPRVLVWGGAYGFRHPSITTGERTFVELAHATGDFSVTVTENPADLRMDVLREYDALAWISTTGKAPLTQTQRDEVIRWSSCGGANLGFHAVLDSEYGWAEHTELFGAQFDSHPKNVGSGAARMLVEDRKHPITAGWKGAPSFMLDDEYYRWRTAKRVPGISLPRKDPATRVLLSLDETSVGGGIQSGPLAYEHHQPIAWTKTFRGKGRVYYNNMGHSDSTWDDPAFRISLVNGIAWTTAVRPDQKCLDGTAPVATRLTPPKPVQRQVGKPCTVPRIAPRGGGAWETAGAARALRETGDRQQVSAGIAGGLAWGAQTWVLDVSRSKARRADVRVRLSWPAPVDDYDLSVTTAWGTYGRTDGVGTTAEELLLRDVPHCAVLQVYANNMYAVTRQAPTLEVSVAPKR